MRDTYKPRNSLDDLQGRVRSVLIEVSDRLQPVTVELVTEMVDVGEQGVALEILSNMLVESGARLSQQTFDDIGELGHSMRLELPMSSLRTQVDPG